MTNVYERERTLLREVSQHVEAGMPGVDVLALELLSPARFCVYIDHPQGVDHALCERVTALLRGYLDRFAVDVSSPGVERPLRKPSHFAGALGRRVSVRTSEDIGGRKRFRGELVAAGDRTLQIAIADDGAVEIPYETIVRGNLIDEG
ncbi:MAG: ribosome maturation factor RimP [Actinobacteria bacterium]|nr:ribosome maturation factor RimP [Actinomycetota bacterium]